MLPKLFYMKDYQCLTTDSHLVRWHPKETHLMWAGTEWYKEEVQEHKSLLCLIVGHITIIIFCQDDRQFD